MIDGQVSIVHARIDSVMLTTHRLEQQVADAGLLRVPLRAPRVQLLHERLVLTKNLRNLEEYFVDGARVHDVGVLLFQWLYVFLWKRDKTIPRDVRLAEKFAINSKSMCNRAVAQKATGVR